VLRWVAMTAWTELQNWLLPASQEMTALALLLSEEDTASFFTMKFLKMETGNGCPHAFTQHTLHLTAAHTAGKVCLKFLYLLSVRTQVSEHHTVIVCYMFRPCLAIIR